MSASGDPFQMRLTAVAERIEAELAALLDEAALPGETHRPARLMGAMRHAALAGGKRLRPFLLIETARALGHEGAGVLRAAAALEMLHCYSLVHDDLPAMDDDDMRRGRPTVHVAYDEATAILAGDGLLTLAFDVLADPATHADPAIRLALVTGLARAAGVGGMVGGQMLDLAAENAAAPLPEAEVRQLQAMKTGALLRYAVEAGAVLGGASASQCAALARYGAALGAAFQIADDLLDAEGDAAALGKKAGKDAGRNKATLVSLLGLEAARAECARLVGAAEAALAEALAPEQGLILAQAARFVAQRRS